MSYMINASLSSCCAATRKAVCEGSAAAAASGAAPMARAAAGPRRGGAGGMPLRLRHAPCAVVVFVEFGSERSENDLEACWLLEAMVKRLVGVP